MKQIGVLALQGGVEEHCKMLNRIENVQAVKVKYLSDLDQIDGLIIPGGESTTLGTLLTAFKILEPLKEKINKGLPVWGTCAGMILLAKEMVDEDISRLAVMDINVKRNAYGRQLESFKVIKSMKEVGSEAIPLTFIRAPYVTRVKQNVKVLLEVDGHIVACRQDNMLATSFHPELEDSTAFHEYFIKEIVG